MQYVPLEIGTETLKNTAGSFWLFLILFLTRVVLILTRLQSKSKNRYYFPRLA